MKHLKYPKPNQDAKNYTKHSLARIFPNLVVSKGLARHKHHVVCKNNIVSRRPEDQVDEYNQRIIGLRILTRSLRLFPNLPSRASPRDLL